MPSPLCGCGRTINTKIASSNGALIMYFLYNVERVILMQIVLVVSFSKAGGVGVFVLLRRAGNQQRKGTDTVSSVVPFG